LERSHIAANPDLAIFAGDPGRSECRHLDWVLWRGEPLQGMLLQWIEDDNRDASARCVVQLSHHARAIGSGVLADNEDGVSVREVVEHDGPLADAYRFRKADAGRLMAHVGTIRHVIR